MITKDSVVIVTGGGRGITASCVKQLSQEYPCHYILLGRTPLDKKGIQEGIVSKTTDPELKKLIMDRIVAEGKKPSPQLVEKQFKRIRAQLEIEETIDSLHRNGAKAEYLSVDITDKEMVKDSMKDVTNRFGPVTGIIHGAGTLADKRIEKKTAEDFEFVVSPKVDGIRNLLNTVSMKNLDFLVLFSSIVGVFGNIGQADYAIANEVLNKTAYQVKRENPDCRVLSINWGPWDSGMVTPELAKAFAERNMPVIPASAGAELLVKLLSNTNSSSLEPIQIVVGSIPNRPPVNITTELTTYYINRTLILEKNPFLVDHMIGENPVLPATCAASWVASVSEQLYPGYAFSSIEDFKVLKGIVFDGSLSREHCLELKETQKSPDGNVQFKAQITSEKSNGNPVFHYSLNVELDRVPKPVTKHILSLLKEKNNNFPIPGKKLYEDGTLFHGPSFQGVKQVLHLSEGRMVLECNLPALPPEKQGQFPTQTTNPFVYDAIVQSILIWSQRFYDAPCLPSHLEKLEHFKAIPFEKNCLVDVQIISHTKSHVIADIWVTDKNGDVYVIFHKLKGTISPLLRHLIGKKNVD